MYIACANRKVTAAAGGDTLVVDAINTTVASGGNVCLYLSEDDRNTTSASGGSDPVQYTIVVGGTNTNLWADGYTGGANPVAMENYLDDRDFNSVDATWLDLGGTILNGANPCPID